MENKKSKLKPCPFCGSDAEIKIMKTHQAQIAYVDCTVCSCRKTRLEYPNYDGDIEYDMIDSWNRRVNDGGKNKKAKKEVNPQTD